jgi:hypothetical protein
VRWCVAGYVVGPEQHYCCMKRVAAQFEDHATAMCSYAYKLIRRLLTCRAGAAQQVLLLVQA